MYTLIIALIIIASLLMVGIVLIQESKGGGLASSFSSSNQIMGVRKTTDFLEKATWGLAIAMVVLSIVSGSFVSKGQERKSVDAAKALQQTQQSQEQTQEESTTPAPAEGQQN